MKKIQLIVLLTFSIVLHAQTNSNKESYSFSLNEAIDGKQLLSVYLKLMRLWDTKTILNCKNL